MALPGNGRVVDINKGAAAVEGGLHLGGNVWFFSFDAAMVDGVSGTGAGIAGPGSICGNSSDGKGYINTGTQASPVWTVIGAQT